MNIVDVFVHCDLTSLGVLLIVDIRLDMRWLFSSNSDEEAGKGAWIVDVFSFSFCLLRRIDIRQCDIITKISKITRRNIPIVHMRNKNHLSARKLSDVWKIKLFDDRYGVWDDDVDDVDGIQQ